MAKKDKAAEGGNEGVLISAAKAIGTAAGNIAKLAGAATAGAEPAKSKKVPKLAKTGKKRLPRKEKKALQKSLK